ncbi:hypothetical protein ABZ345_16375 [Lentzea sp. NPDC005914]|uniref:hypothetical protein n=1 Tax=Lentzea sp. NPDC005914 TaxID=3154572 RepID=UPI0033C8663F
MFKSPSPRLIAGLMVLAGVVLLLFFAPDLPAAIDYQFERGTPGTYVIDDEPTCVWDRPERCSTRRGTFTSDDGTVTRTVELPGFLPEGSSRGDRLRAYDIGEPLAVYSKETDGYPVAVVFLACGLGPLMVLFGGLYLWRRRDRPQRG